MKFLFLSTALVGLFFVSTFIIPMQHLRAEDVIQMNGQEIAMSGTITEMDNDGFTLSTGETSTKVTLENMKNNAADVADLLKEGMKVTVRGTLMKGSFNEPTINASNIASIQQPLVPGAPVPPTAGSTAVTP